MGEWTPEREAEAEVWAKERGAKGRIIADALSEIARLRKTMATLEAKHTRLGKACWAFFDGYNLALYARTDKECYTQLADAVTKLKVAEQDRGKKPPP